jgi:microcystin degradation protein MlrC
VSRPRILLAGLFHETHTFVDEITPLRDFAILRGDEMTACAGDASPLGGVLEAARQFGWDVIPALDVRASPSGLVADEVVDFWWEEFTARAAAPLRAGEIDGIYLVLHGAMVAASHPDVEGELLERIRALPGAAGLPLFGVFDLHANFSRRMADLADGWVAYRENPHSDARAMAVLAAERLRETLASGTRPRQWFRSPGILWPPTGTGTADAPMRDLEALARELEAGHPSFLAVNVVAGFAFADTPDTGVSFTVCSTGPEAEAREALDRLERLAWELRHVGAAADLPVEEALRQAAGADPGAGPVVIAEPSDNIGGGAPGDGTGLLRALVRHRVPGAAVCLNDPEAVQALAGRAPGDRVRLALGGKGSRLDDGPLPLDVTFVSRGDGRFRLEDRQSHLASLTGDTFDMGPCAVVRHEGITILLTSRKTPPFDLGQWRSQGLAPESFRFIGVKAAVAHRRAYAPIASLLLAADTPGPCRSDVRALPYRAIRRPVFPLDGDARLPSESPSLP